jgi:hypothetical protein
VVVVRLVFEAGFGQTNAWEGWRVVWTGIGCRIEWPLPTFLSRGRGLESARTGGSDSLFLSDSDISLIMIVRLRVVGDTGPTGLSNLTGLGTGNAFASRLAIISSSLF